jgi:hypothetical protein
MKTYNVVIKDNKYLTANGKLTTNPNLAYTYETKEQAQQIADQIQGIATKLTI